MKLLLANLVVLMIAGLAKVRFIDFEFVDTMRSLFHGQRHYTSNRRATPIEENILLHGYTGIPKAYLRFTSHKQVL